MYDKILVCVTGAKNSVEVAHVGLSVASRNAQVIFLHAVPLLDDAARAQADRDLAHIRTIMLERPPVRAEFVVVEGEPRHKIMELAQKNGVHAIVVGESPEHGAESVSDYLLHHAPQAVISVKAKR